MPVSPVREPDVVHISPVPAATQDLEAALFSRQDDPSNFMTSSFAAAHKEDTSEDNFVVGFNDGLDLMFCVTCFLSTAMGFIILVMAFSGQDAQPSAPQTPSVQKLVTEVQGSTWRLHRWLVLPGGLSVVQGAAVFSAWFTSSGPLLVQLQHLYTAVLAACLLVLVMAAAQRTTMSSNTLTTLHRLWSPMSSEDRCAAQQYFLCSGFSTSCIGEVNATAAECPESCDLSKPDEYSRLLGYTFTAPGYLEEDPFETPCSERFAALAGISRTVTVAAALLVALQCLYALFLYRKIILRAPVSVTLSAV